MNGSKYGNEAERARIAVVHYSYIRIHISLFILGSPSGKKPLIYLLQGAILKKKKATIYSKRNAVVTTNGIKKQMRVNAKRDLDRLRTLLLFF